MENATAVVPQFYIHNNLVYINWNDLIPDILDKHLLEVKEPRMKTTSSALVVPHVRDFRPVLKHFF